MHTNPMQRLERLPKTQTTFSKPSMYNHSAQSTFSKPSVHSHSAQSYITSYLRSFFNNLYDRYSCRGLNHYAWFSLPFQVITEAIAGTPYRCPFLPFNHLKENDSLREVRRTFQKNHGRKYAIDFTSAGLHKSSCEKNCLQHMHPIP